MATPSSASTIASLAYYCAPIIVMALSPLLFKEPITGRIIGSFCVVVAGALLLNGSVNTDDASSAWGMLCGWASAICHAAMVVFSKKADKVEGLASSLIQLATSFLVAFVYLVLTGGLFFTVEEASWPWVLVLGLANTGLGCYLYFSSFRGLKAQTVAILGYLEPLSAVACALIFLGEPISAIQGIGGLLIVGGALLGTLNRGS